MSTRAGPPSPQAPASVFELPLRWLFPLIFFAAFLAYLPAFSAGFIWDDAGHVTRPDLRSLAGLGRIWFEIGATQQYYPLLHSAFWFEHRLWGDSPLGYHLLNVLLHAANACLFATLLRRLALPGAAFAALLFALHPICVESVVWISEQKNTLSTLLYLAAALTYLKFHDRASHAKSQSPNSKRYLLATALFLGALLTKTVTATLPAALLVVLWWRHGRLEWRRDVVPLLPWFALGAAAGLFTAHFERALIGAQGAAFDLSFVERFLLAGRVAWFYLGNLLWPANLTFIYPRWTIDASVWWQWLFPLAAVAVLAAALRSARRHSWSRGVLAALLLFGGTLFPVLGFFNVYPFLFSYVADHFQYLASLSLLALFAAALTRLSTRLPSAARFSIAIAVLVVLASLTFVQSRTYRDELTLWQTTLVRNPSAWMAHNNLAIVLAESGRVAEAVPHLEEALRLRPDYAQAHNNLGDDLTRLARPAEAVPHLEEAIRLQPNYPEAHNNLGNALLALDRPADAIARYEQAIRLRPAYATAHRNLGLAIAASGRNADAIPHFERAAALDPRDAQAELNLGIALMLTRRFDQAVPHFRRAVELDPDTPKTHLMVGRAFLQNGRPDEALIRLRTALDLDPNYADAHLGLGFALRQLGRTEEAQHHFLAARRLGAE